MALELEGRIAQKMNVQSGTTARGAWSKQEFIFEYQEGNYPTKVVMHVWGDDKVRELDKYQVNDKVKVSFNLSSREYNGRCYTDVRVWRIEPAQTGASAQPSYQTPMPPAAPMPTVDDMSEPAGDDLPF
jgi:hypothetical protein